MSTLCPSMILTTYLDDGLKRGHPYVFGTPTQGQTRNTRVPESEFISTQLRHHILLQVTSIQKVHGTEPERTVWGAECGFHLRIAQNDFAFNLPRILCLTSAKGAA